MTIDEGALAHIMSVLTDLYSDPEMAVIREYSTNARDSHIEAGIPDRPIEVTLPSALAPSLKIRDFGVGLDADDIREIYSRYGASTKRESDDVVGMLGLGCKSGLTYADQFTLSGIKDGVRTEVSVSRDEDGTGSMTLVAQYETDDEDGVEVTIPARKGNSFEEKAAEFFRFWEKGTVLVNGEAPKRVDGLWIADDLLLSEDRTLPGMTVVMGGVPYPVDEYQYRYRTQKLVAFVGIGDVQFTPSRESLQMTARTKATLARIDEREKIEKEIALKKLVEEATDAFDAVRVLATAQRLGLKGAATWQGRVVPLKADRPQDGVMALAECPKAYRDKGWDDRTAAPLGTNLIWLTGFKGAKFTPYKRRKLDQWYGKQDVLRAQAQRHTFCIVDEIPAEVAEWIDPKNVLPWDDVEAEKIAKDKPVDGTHKVLGTYDAWVADGHYKRGIPADELPTKNLFFFNGRSGWNAERTPFVDLVTAKRPGAVIVPLPANRVAKFQRDFPKAKELNQYARKLAEKYVAGLTDEDRFAIAADSVRPRVLNTLNPELVQDPELASVIRAQKHGSKVRAELAQFSRVAPGAADIRGATDKVKKIIDRYPLLFALPGYGAPHNDVYIYLNAAYLSKQLAPRKEES